MRFNSSPEINWGRAGFQKSSEFIFEDGYDRSLLLQVNNPSPVSSGLVLPSAGCLEGRAGMLRVSPAEELEVPRSPLSRTWVSPVALSLLPLLLHPLGSSVQLPGPVAMAALTDYRSSACQRSAAIYSRFLTSVSPPDQI